MVPTVFNMFRRQSSSSGASLCIPGEQNSIDLAPVLATAPLFDLDGALVDSVYQHVLAWKEGLDAEGIELSIWRIHRKIG